MKSHSIYWRAVALFACFVWSVAGQNRTPQVHDTDDQTVPAQDQAAMASNASCNAFVLQSAPYLTVKQRGCFFACQLASPQLAMRTVAMAAFDQYRNSPQVRHDSWGRFPHRIEVSYARHAARYSGEFLVGALHHEEPRPQSSHAGGFWRRTNAAFLDVVTSPAEDGRLRPAFAPIAGSFSSAAVGTVLDRRSETFPNVLAKAAICYGFYFVRATYAEFKPDLVSTAHKLLLH